MATVEVEEVSIPPLGLGATLCTPSRPQGVVLFAHGSGSSRFSPRNNAVADALNRTGFATLLLDLLTGDEEGDRGKVFDIALLQSRLRTAVDWIDARPKLAVLPLGLFGASTGAAAALQLAARLHGRVKAVVSRGGRPDLTGQLLHEVSAPTLLIVGGDDEMVLQLNRAAYEDLPGPRRCTSSLARLIYFPNPGRWTR